MRPLVFVLAAACSADPVTPAYPDCAPDCWFVVDDREDEAEAFEADGLGPYHLALRPVPDSLSVQVEDADVFYDFAEDQDWTWDEAANGLRFTDYQPPADAIVWARYQVEVAEFVEVRCSDVVICP